MSLTRARVAAYNGPTGTGFVIESQYKPNWFWRLLGNKEEWYIWSISQRGFYRAFTSPNNNYFHPKVFATKEEAEREIEAIIFARWMADHPESVDRLRHRMGNDDIVE